MSSIGDMDCGQLFPSSAYVLYNPSIYFLSILREPGNITALSSIHFDVSPIFHGGMSIITSKSTFD